MNSVREDCYILPVLDKYLVYSPLTGISALVNKTAVTELKALLSKINEGGGKYNSRLYDLAQDLLNGQVLSPIRKDGDLNPLFLGIIPTRTCNGACTYCDFAADNASNDRMSYQMAARAVDWYTDLMKAQNRKYLDIHFFGGEPMVARDVIEVVIQRARIMTSGTEMIPLFEISTNGQYGREDADYLGQYFNKVVLSFDGFKEVQDKHRPLRNNNSSFENVLRTAGIIGNSNAELCIRSCISRENVMQMEEFTQWLCENFNLAAINFEVLTPSPLSVSFGLLPPDCFDFAINFEKSRELAKDFGVTVIYASDIAAYPVVTSCPAGKDTAIFSPDGRISNCYLPQAKWKDVGLDLDFGVVTSDNSISLDAEKIKAIREMVENKPRCAKCFCKWSCAGGCHVGITYPGCSENYDDFCKQTRLISAFTLLSDIGSTDYLKDLSKSDEYLHILASQQTDSITDFT
jgi:uncharacterized protein